MADTNLFIDGKEDFSIIEKAFSGAIMDVVSTMAGIELEKDFGAENPTADLTGVMTLICRNNSIASLSLSTDSAKILVSYMTGIYAEDLKDEDVYDGVAELVNMICGRAKVMLSETEYSFSLTAPFVVSGKDHLIVHKNNVKKIELRFRLEGTIIGLHLTFM